MQRLQKDDEAARLYRHGAIRQAPGFRLTVGASTSIFMVAGCSWSIMLSNSMRHPCKAHGGVRKHVQKRAGQLPCGTGTSTHLQSLSHLAQRLRCTRQAGVQVLGKLLLVACQLASTCGVTAAAGLAHACNKCAECGTWACST